jgi:hypothetical protein
MANELRHHRTEVEALIQLKRMAPEVAGGVLCELEGPACARDYRFEVAVGPTPAVFN